MQKKTRVFLYTALGVVIVAAVAAPRLRVWAPSGGDDAPASATTTPDLPVEAYIVKPGKLEHKISATGSVVANEEVELHSETSGMITGIFFDEGSTVKKGELLMKINDADLQAQLLKQKYQLELATDREARQRQLLEKNLISQENYDFALNALNTVKADIAFLEAQIRKTEIHAPFDGIVGLRYVSRGSYISPSTKIASLINLNPIKIDFSVPEKYANAVHKGDDFSYQIAGAERVYHGKVIATEPKIEHSTRTLQVRGISPNESGQILPGAFAEVELVLQRLDRAILVPTMALIPEFQRQKIFLYQNGKAVPRYITSGIRTETRVQVVDGLAAGDTVITSGVLQLRPGAGVSISKLVQN